MPDVGLDFEDLTRVREGVAPQIFPVVGNTPAGLLLLLLLLLLCSDGLSTEKKAWVAMSYQNFLFEV
jgi:hypothetical protein